MENDPRESAIANALRAIRRDRRFPGNVFVQAWDDYLFFESFMMFDEMFIEAKDIILREEGSSEIALENLGNSLGGSDLGPQVIFLNRSTTYSEYFSKLKGDGSPLNWIFLMERYVCASDKGNWCMYCEKENDIAVLAVRRSFSAPVLMRLRNLLKADSISTICDSQIDHLFNFSKLVSSWKTALAANYVVG